MNTTCHPRRSRTRLLQRAAAAAVVAGGAGVLMLSASGVAFASLNQTAPQWAEIGPWGYTGNQSSQVTAVYTIQSVIEPGTEMLEDRGNSMSNGGTVDVWTQYEQSSNQDPMGTGPYGPITQANYLWEFVPANPGAGGSILNGPGELINRQSGLCLDIDNNNTGNNAAIDQWACNGGANQQWAAEPDNSGSYEIVSVLDGDAKALGIGTQSTCVLAGNGDSVSVYTTDNYNSCEQWNIQQASYDFASYPISVPSGHVEADGRGYECVPGDTLRNTGHTSGQVAGNAVENYWDFRNIGDSGVTPEDPWYADDHDVTPPPYMPNGTILYIQYSTGSETGQVMLYCDPPTQTP